MESVTGHFSSTVSSAPVIGISGSDAGSKSVIAMMSRVREVGATPLLLANHINRDAAKDTGKCDAVIIMGNDFDADPNEYIDRYPEGDARRRVHPETRNVSSTPNTAARATYEKALIDATLLEKMPLFCICGGMHQLNIRLGGTLHQHIPDLIGHNKYANNDGKDAWSPVCSISIVEDSILARIAATQLLFAPGIPPLVPSNGTVNSFHHQAVDIVGSHLVASAFSDYYQHEDGSEARLVEAIEADAQGKYKDQFILGVQWHPEFLPDAPSTDKMIRDLAEEAQKFAQAQDRHHTSHDTERENLLSALPIIRSMSGKSSSKSYTENITAPTVGQSLPPGRSR